MGAQYEDEIRKAEALILEVEISGRPTKDSGYHSAKEQIQSYRAYLENLRNIKNNI